MSASIKVIKSGAILLATQVIERGLGIISTLILARLLTPEHFGIIALIVISMQFFELLVEAGTQHYIVQKADIQPDDLNTAWSLDILCKTAVAIAIIALSNPIGHYFEAPSLALPLSLSALTLPIRALATPGMMQLTREINYRPYFQLTLWQKSLSFILVISWALTDASYWAIIAGNLLSATIFTIGSYIVHPFRPRWTLTHLRQQWCFSQWLMLRGIVGFFRSQIDNILVSKLFGTERLGGYNLIRDIGLLPAVTVVVPMQEPLMAALAQERNNLSQLAYRTRMCLWLTISFTLPITVFLLSYPTLIVNVLLGQQWEAYSPLLAPFGFTFFSFCLFALICDTMIAQGKVRTLFSADLISTLLIFPALMLYGHESMLKMAWTRGWLAIITVIAYLYILDQQTKFGLLRLFELSIPCILGCTCGLLVSTLSTSSTEHSRVLELAIRGTSFLLTYTGIILLSANLLLKHSPEWQQTRTLAIKYCSSIGRKVMRV